MSIEYIGIDLGTTNSIVSYMEKGKSKVLKIGKSEIVPSAIFFESKDKQLFGQKALERMITYPECGIRLFKRMLKDYTATQKIKFRKKNEINNIIKDTYLIDTNIFIHCPNILDRVCEGERVILPYTVLDELRFRAEDPNTKYQAEAARDSIYKYREKENSIIELREINEEFIPQGCFKSARIANDRNDNGILSIAIEAKHNGEDIILLTGDNGLRTKAIENNIENKNLDDFLNKHSIVNTYNDDFIELTGQKASAIFLQYLREESCKKLKSDIKKAVITVPANFSIVEIEATKDAGIDAGFEEVIIMKEPIAAAIVYGVEEETNKKILVYDFGGGTFDVSIIEVKDNKTMNVLNTEGDSNLGGEDITNKIVELLYDKVYDKYELDMDSLESSCLSEDEYKYNQMTIRNAAESVKIGLSETTEENITLINLNIGEEEKGSITTSITRDELEKEVLIDISKKAEKTLNKCLNNINLTKEDIDIIVLAGGTSSIPVFREHISKTFGKSPNFEKNVATIVSNGAAIRAEQIWGGNGVTVYDIYENTEHDFGVKLENFTFDTLIPANTPTPAIANKIYMPAKSGQSGVSIMVLQRDKGCTKFKTFDDGIEVIDEIRIDNLPSDIENTDVKINVKFEISKEGTLSVSTNLVDRDGNEVYKDTSIKVTRQSKL